MQPDEKKAPKLNTVQMQMCLAVVSAEDPAAPVWRATQRACSPFQALHWV